MEQVWVVNGFDSDDDRTKAVFLDKGKALTHALYWQNGLLRERPGAITELTGDDAAVFEAATGEQFTADKLHAALYAELEQRRADLIEHMNRATCRSRTFGCAYQGEQHDV